jgi:hypothetical protein
MGQRVVDVANKALEEGNKVAVLQAKIEDMEDASNLRRAKNDLAVAKLRERAIREEGDTRRATIEEAIKLEKESADESLRIAGKKVELARLELGTAKDKKKAQDDLEDAEVNFIKVQAERYQATLRFEKQLESLREQEEKEREKREEAQRKREEEAQEKILKKQEEDKRRKNEFDKSIADFGVQVVNQAQDQEDARKKKSAEYEKNIENFKNQALDSAANLFFAKKQGLRIATNAIFKQDAIKEIYITTRAAAMKAYDAFAKIPLVGPALGVAAAGATIAYGASQVAQVVGIPFARGGRVLSGQRIRSGDGQPIYRSNGDNLLASVRTGEVILNERQQAMLGGDRTFRRIGVPGFATGGMVGNDITKTTLQLDKVLTAINKQKTVLVLEDFERVSNRKYDAEKTAIVV